MNTASDKWWTPSSICIMEIPEGEEWLKWAERIFEEMVAENILNLKNTNL